MLEYRTAGESHGKALAAILEGIPAGLSIGKEDIDEELKRRQMGYGRGARMQIESDEVQLLSGIRDGMTIGSPIGLLIENRDWENWKNEMSARAVDSEPVTRPRPGHADLAGYYKYRHKDLRNVLERASARETAARVAVGAVCSKLLKELGMWIIGFVRSIGSVTMAGSPGFAEHGDPQTRFENWRKQEQEHPLRCPDSDVEFQMVELIDRCKEAGDTLGGSVEIRVAGVPPGLGSYAQWSQRLDGLMTQALMAIPGIKAVELGEGILAAESRGSQVHDAILPTRNNQGNFERQSNNAGGVEGGVSNGEDVWLRAYMKPISTLGKALPSVDINTGEKYAAHHERSDVCAVPAAGVVAESAVAIELARAVVDRFAADSVTDLKRSFWPGGECS